MINKILDAHFEWLANKSTRFALMFFTIECYLLTFVAYELCKFIWNLLF